MKEKQFFKIPADFKLIMMIWITHNKINGVATDDFNNFEQTTVAILSAK